VKVENSVEPHGGSLPAHPTGATRASRKEVRFDGYGIFDVTRECRLSANAQHILTVIFFEADFRNEMWQGSYRDLSNRSGRTTGVCKAAVGELLEAGLLVEEQPFKKNGSARLSIPCWGEVIASQRNVGGRPVGSRDTTPRQPRSTSASQTPPENALASTLKDTANIANLTYDPSETQQSGDFSKNPRNKATRKEVSVGTEAGENQNSEIRAEGKSNDFCAAPHCTLPIAGHPFGEPGMPCDHDVAYPNGRTFRDYPYGWEEEAERQMLEWDRAEGRA